MKKEILLSAAIGLGITALTNTASAAPKWAKAGDTIVKCKGIAKKGKNDCGANGHSCHGQAKKSNDKNEWIYVPKGVCEKLTDGAVLAEKTIKKKA